MNKNLNLPSNETLCDICNEKIRITKDTLKEENVTLKKDNLSHDVVLTHLRCPSCGKVYPVIMDDKTTLPILRELRGCMVRRMKFYGKQKPIPQKLQEKYTKLNRKLDFKRQQLAEKFNGALYQSEGDTIQLDYRYHAR
nr:MAG TPA: MqsA [Caudoviricetes sp.]